MNSTPQAKELRRLLRAQGSSGRKATGQEGWNAYKNYAREMFGEDVLLLFQVGTHTFSDTSLFYFDPVVQFEIMDYDGEHDHFEQLHLQMTCVPSNSLKFIQDELWSIEFPTADAFFTAVESRPSFQIAVNQSNYRAAVLHEDV